MVIPTSKSTPANVPGNGNPRPNQPPAHVTLTDGSSLSPTKSFNFDSLDAPCVRIVVEDAQK